MRGGISYMLMSSSHIAGNHSFIFVIVISDQLGPCVWGLGSDPPLGTSLLLHMAGLGSLIVQTGRTAKKTSPQRKSPYELLLTSCLLISHWPKQVKWPSLDSKGEKEKNKNKNLHLLIVNVYERFSLKMTDHR